MKFFDLVQAGWNRKKAKQKTKTKKKLHLVIIEVRWWRWRTEQKWNLMFSYVKKGYVKKSRRSLKYFSSSYRNVLLVDEFGSSLYQHQTVKSRCWRILTVVYHMPIQCRLSPEWRRASVGFRYMRSSRRAETHRGPPAVNKKRTTEVYTTHTNTRTRRREHG